MATEELTFETLDPSRLAEISGGKQTWRQLSAFAQQRGFHVTSAMGGHHLGWAHKAGRAVDVRTRDHTRAQVNAFIRDARRHGITVFDERGGGNRAWSGPHVHLQL